MKCYKHFGYYLSLFLLIALSALPSRAIMDITVGTATTTTSTYPFIGNYGGSKTQLIFTGAELTAAGALAGNINSIAFNMTSNTATTNTLSSFTVKAQTTTLTTFATSFVTTNWTEVYNGTFTLSTTAGWQTINFQTPFAWDGTSNIMFEVCWANSASTRGGATYVTYTALGTGLNRCRSVNEDNRTNCTGITGSGTNQLNRPNVKFGIVTTLPYMLTNTNSLSFNFKDPGTYSTAQIISITGDNLNPASGNFTVTPPDGFQVSLDGTNWVSFPNTLTVPYVGNPINTASTFQVRFAPTAAQSYTGNVAISGGSATAVNIAVSGTGILSYCASNATGTTGGDIASVAIANLTNASQAITPITSNTAANQTYNDYRSTQPAIQVQAGTTVPYTIKFIASSTWSTSYLKVYIDLNRDGVVTQSELLDSMQITSTTLTSASGSFTRNLVIPPTVAYNQNTMIRFILTTTASTSFCGTYTNGETEDYWINFTPPNPFLISSITTKDFGYFAPTTQSTSQSVVLTAGAFNPEVGSLTITPSTNFQVSLDGNSWNSVATQLPYTNYGFTLNPGTIFIRYNSPAELALVHNGTVTFSGGGIANPVTINVSGANMQTYPASTVSTTSTTDTIDIARISIANVTFGDANVTPLFGRTEAINKYTDNRLAAPAIELHAGTLYPFTVNAYSSGAALPLCSLSIYIDYNADGDFADLGETVTTKAIPVDSNGQVSGSFLVPPTAVVNPVNSPRVRFVLSNTTPSATSTTYLRGETEDYTLSILPALPMQYVSTTTTQVSKSSINKGNLNEKILKVTINNLNSGNPLTVSQIVFNTNGTNQTDAITNAKVYFTLDTNNFTTNTLVGNIIPDPNGEMIFTPPTPITLTVGDNYFWLAYDIAGDANLDAIVDAQLTGLYISDAPAVNKITTAQSPEGFALINSLKFDGSFNATYSTTQQNFPWNGWTAPGASYPWYLRSVGRNNALSAEPVSTPYMAELYGYFVDNTTRDLYSPAFNLGPAELPATLTFWMYRTSISGETTPSYLSVKINTSASNTGATVLSTVGENPLTQISADINTAPIVEEEGWYKYTITIPDTYVPGASNYLLFQGFGDYDNNFYIDDVTFGEDAFMNYMTNTTLPSYYNFALIGSQNVMVGEFNINTLASNSPLSLTNFKFTPTGTTNINDISNAKIWAYNAENFDPATAQLLATVPVINSGINSIDFATPFTMLEGDNHFVVTYDIANTTIPNNATDIEFNTFTLTRGTTSTERSFTTSNPTGNILLQEPLNGTYTIGGTVLPERYFADLAVASNALFVLGASANVEFAIAADQNCGENTPVFGPTTEVGIGGYTLTIYPKDEPRTINGNFAGNSGGVITFIGTDNVTIDGRVNQTGDLNGLNIVNNLEGPGLCFGSSPIYGFSSNVTIKYTNFKANTTTNSVDAYGIYLVGNSHDNFNIHNNSFERISGGVYAMGGSTETTDITNINIHENTFGNSTESLRLRKNAVSLAYVTNSTITDNLFKGLGSTNTNLNVGNYSGIVLAAGVMNADINNNTFVDFKNYHTSGYGAYGVNVSATSDTNIYIYNNVFSDFICDGYNASLTDNPFAIRINGGNNIQVFYNTVNFLGAYSGSEQAFSACLAVTSTSSHPTLLLVEKNIFINSLTNTSTSTKSYAIYAPAGYAFSTINDNDYYVSGARGVLGYLGIDKTTLVDWRTATAQDVNSVNTNVTFLSNSDLHLSGASALNSALTCEPVGGVLIDMDKLSRSVNITQMGADQAYASITLNTQPIASANLCINPEQSNPFEIEAGTVTVSAFDDGIVRDINPANLKYTWTKNGTDMSVNTYNLPINYSQTTTTPDSYQATVYGLYDQVTFEPILVNAYANPSVFTLTGTGSLCPNSQIGVQLTLSGSESGIEYQLINNNSPIGTPIIGSGDPITFDNITTIGDITCMAYNLATNCSSQMTGTATITTLPTATVFNVTGGGTYCSDQTTTFEIGISNSEVGVAYMLLRDDTPILQTSVDGTGQALSFGQFSEAGVYTVMGTLGNCNTNMNNSVSINVNPAPELFTVTNSVSTTESTVSVCTDYLPITISLPGSELNVNYQLLQNGQALGTSITGTGNPLTFENINQSGLYTIQATKGTCTREMTGLCSLTVNPSPNKYRLIGNGIICSNVSATIPMILENSEIDVSYQLYRESPTAPVAVGNPVIGTGQPITLGSYNTAGTYHVEATKGNCSNIMLGVATIIVNQAPTAYTLQSGQQSGQFTVNRCANGDAVILSLSNSQLNTSYQLYHNTLPIFDPVQGNGSSISFIPVTEAGNYTVVATNEYCTENMTGSATINVNPAPALFNVTGGGAICDGSQIMIPIGLSGSVQGTTYQLYRTVATSTVTVGSPVQGTGQPLNFGNFNVAGTYTVKATLGTCQATMTGQALITISSSPAFFTLKSGTQTGQFSIIKCLNDAPIVFGISGSEANVSYQLLRNGQPINALVQGTGSAISFASVNESGTYTVIGDKNGCTNIMTGSANLTVNPMPQVFNVTGTATICSASNGTPIGLSGSQVGAAYQLYLNNTASGTPVQGTGSAINFGMKTVAGTYTVKATMTATSCNIDMNGNAIITVTNNPIAYNLTGGGEICNDGRGLMVSVANSEQGVIYNLFRNSLPFGTPVIGTGSAINFGYINTSGTYTVVADRNGCTTNMTGSVNIIIKPNPNNYDVLVNGNNVNEKTLCQGEALTIGLSNTEQGVIYTLFINADATQNVITGSGSAMSFTAIQAPTSGVYQVFANKDNCTKQMDADIDVIVKPLPQAFNVIGGGSICAGDNPVQVTLSGSEIGVVYNVFRDATPYGQPVQGTGNAIVLATDNAAGVFTATADKDGCTLDMTGSASIIVRPMPQIYNVTSTGSTNCSSTGIDVLLSGSEQGTVYTLLFNNNAIDNPLNGTGNQLSFGIHSAEGVYTIRANRNNCIAMMNGQINLRIDDPPTAYTITGGGLICQGDNGLRITQDNSQSDVTYQVKLNNQNIGNAVAGTGSAMTFGPFTGAGTYTVVGSADGCETQMNGTVVITNAPKPTVTINGPNEIVQATQGTYTANAENGMNYLWTVRGGSIVGANNLADVTILWGTSQRGTVTLRKINTTTECYNEANFEVTILNVPVPSIQASGLIFTSVTQNSMMLRWTRGNGNRVLVVATTDDNFTANPQVGDSYNANTNYGQGDPIGNAFVVFNGTGRICNVTNLTPGTIYKFKVYEYFTADNAYNLTDANLNPRSKTTAIAAPTNLALEDVDVNESLISWEYTGNSDFMEVQLAYNSNFTNIVPGYENSDFGNVSATALEDLTANTPYFVRVRAHLASTVSPWSNVLSFSTLIAEPTIAPTNVTVSNRTVSSYNVRWTNGSGQYSIVLASTSPITSLPQDRIEYTANADFSSVLSSIIGDAKVVYNGTADNFTLSGLQTETEYNLAVFTFDGNGGSQNYNPTPASGIGATLNEEPSIPPSNLQFTNRTVNTLAFNWNAGNSDRFILLRNTSDNFTAPIDGTTYQESDLLGDATILAIGNLNNFTNGSLSADTRYYYAVYGFNGANGTENYLPVSLNGNAKTLASVPADPSGLQIADRFNSSIDLTWNTVNAENYLLLASTSPIADVPAQAVTYQGNLDYTLAANLTNAKVVLAGNAQSAHVIGLNAETRYYFKLYTWNGSNTSEVYSANFASVDGFTFANQPTAPTVAAISNVTVNSMDIDWTNGNSNNNIVLMNTTNSFTAPVDGTTYTLGQTIGSAQVIAVGTTKPVIKTGLTANTTYYYEVYSFNGAAGNENYNPTPAQANDITLPTEPTAVTNLTVTNRTSNTMNLTWTKGNGENTILVAYTNPTAIPVPTDATNYAANSDYSGVGASVIANGKVVYKGNASTAQVTGLSPATTYYFVAYAFNGTNAKTNFNTTAANASAATLSSEPLTAPSNIQFTGTTRTSMNMTWTNGSGTTNLVLRNTVNSFVDPVDGDTYIDGDEIGTAQVIYVGTDNTLALSNLTETTDYFFRVYTFNGTNGEENFLTSTYAAGNNRTRSAAAKLHFKTTPATIVSGQPFSVTVETLDDTNLPVAPDALINITLSETAAGSLFGVLVGTITPAAPEFTFTNLVFNTGTADAQLPLVASDGVSGLEDASINISILSSAPTTQDRIILFSNVAAGGMRLTWTKGNGANRILVMRAGAAITWKPENGVDYTESYLTAVDGNNQYLIYDGPNNTFTITGGLVNGTTYNFRVFGYNGAGTATAYDTAAASFNPRGRAAVAKGDLSPADELTEADINENNSFYLGAINPNPVINQISFEMTVNEEAPMTFTVYDMSGKEIAVLANDQVQTKGTHSFSFSLGDNLASGTYLLMVSAGNQTAVQSFVVVK